jgi:hypothetical protein
LREAPGRYDCVRCAWADHWGALWDVNREAWRVYGALSGRTLRTLDLHGWYLTHLIAGWSSAEIVDLMARLDLILAILQPEDNGGRTRSSN